MATTTIQKREPQAEPSQPEATRGAVFTPRVDIVESGDELLLFADLPGVKPGDVDIRFDKGELILHAHCPPRQSGVNSLAQEYEVGDFYRVFRVAEEIDASRITADLKNGVLTLHLPKTPGGQNSTHYGPGAINVIVSLFQKGSELLEFDGADPSWNRLLLFVNR